MLSSYAMEESQLMRSKHLSSFRPLSPTEHVEVGRIDGGESTCSCCNRRRGDERQTLNLPTRQHCHYHHNVTTNVSSRSLIDDTTDEDEDSDNDDDRDEKDNMYGVLASGVEYKSKRILAEGWLHKKGSGNDFFGSIRWKARYCRLILAKVDGLPVEVPLLLVYWYNSSDVPSTIITLDSTVCMAVDGDDERAWNYHCFNIIHAKGDSIEATRTFTLPRKGRDAWVYAINQALYNYEKEKAKITAKSTAVIASTRKATLLSLTNNSPLTLGLWSGDQFVELSERRIPISPPMSPRSMRKRPLPRPDVLVGESFLP